MIRSEPAVDCSLCPRLASFLASHRREKPTWYNAPVPSFGDPEARLLIVGLAPGLSGANRTGRPFTGDYAGDVLYPALSRYGFAKGTFGADPNDGLTLIDCRITNAVRCVPPQNKPNAGEINTCRRYLVDEIDFSPRPQVILSLGRIAHESVGKVLGLRRKNFPFEHGGVIHLDDGRCVASSYHCSRYNINTGRLTAAMFDSVVATIRRLVSANST